MPSTGDYCETPGHYESACCEAPLEMVMATYFPSCQRCLKVAEWVLVVDSGEQPACRHPKHDL
jgi:hypothetical protein